MSSFVVVGCGPTMNEMAALQIPKERVRNVCWKPAELTDDDDLFAFPSDDGMAVPLKDRLGFRRALSGGGLVFRYNEAAPVRNLKLLPLSRAGDAWCTRIPRPTEEAIQKLLDPCGAAASVADNAPAMKNLLGQTEQSTRSPFFCDQRPRMAPTTQESISLLQRNNAYQGAYEQAEKIAKALTKAEAEMQAVINKSDGWLKRALTEDPGSIEQIQQRVADQLNLIEAPAEYDELYLEMLALAGYNAGFANGKFDVQAKLFAIDAGIFVLELIALEVALGPLGGAKAIVSVVGKGAKAVTMVAAKSSELLALTSTKGGQALAAAMKRLENIPIFIPGAAGGMGAATTVAIVLKVVRQSPARILHLAMKAAGMERAAGTATHHMVAHGHEWAKPARKILAQFGVTINEAVNGVYLPQFLKSPNPNGAIVHATLANNAKYYEKVNKFLEGAASKADLIKRLERIRETLLNGKFFDENL